MRNHPKDKFVRRGGRYMVLGCVTVCEVETAHASRKVLKRMHMIIQ